MKSVRGLLLENSPYLRKLVQSEQYGLSNKLIGLRYSYNLDVEETADYLGLTLYEYVSLENGEMEIEVGVYKEAVDKLAMYRKTETEC